MVNTLDYSKTYIEACFRAWYDAGTPGMGNIEGKASAGGAKVINSLPPDEHGRKPNITTIIKWMNTYGWRERADSLDAEVSIMLDRESVQKRIETLKTLAEAGKSLKDKGLDFITKTDQPFEDNPSAAVRAIVAGSEMEFKYAGAADRLSAINQMSDKQIEQKLLQLLGKESRETEQNENEELINVTPEDIPSDDDTTTEDDD